ncbi:hypothetical protein [Plantactinospora sp. GCM10030261]|uniref:hypothetical protein n=1 Tax=Plantactinospora sp. GCM10030261 TaxID=3273420 RepID=UPI003608101F
MSTYHDPASTGDVYPSEEEIDPADRAMDDAGVEPVAAPVSDAARREAAGWRQPLDSDPPAPPVRPAGPLVGGRSIITHHPDGSTEVVTDLDGDGVADVVQVDLDGDGLPDVTYLDTDRDGRLDTMLGPEGERR